MATAITTPETLHQPQLVPKTITREEYLRTAYHPDCDFVEGHLEERNVGEVEHSRLQKILLRLFDRNEREWNIEALPECRLQVSPDRFRIPDVMVLQRGQRFTGVIRQPPQICIEILSPEDTWTRLRERLDDYLRLGVPHIWCFEPDSRQARRYTAEGFTRVNEPALTVPGTPIRIELAEVFAILDEQ